MGTNHIEIGDVTVTRLEENYGPTVPIDILLPSWDQSLLDDIGPDAVARFADRETNLALLSIHAWVVRTPRHTIVVDTCVGNHKQRTMEDMAMLDTDWLGRLIAAGVQPDEVDAVICTHIHADHVGWNTNLVNGEWVPTFPNAKYYINELESEFWNPSLSDLTGGREFNLNVYEDSILPLFDRDLVELWKGDGCEIDDSLRLELKPGHSPGHAVGWIESGGECGLLSGDSMHTMAQAYRPEWNSVFCFDGPGAAASRRSVLEAAVERNAILLPAHFSAPHAFRVKEDGAGFSLIDAA